MSETNPALEENETESQVVNLEHVEVDIIQAELVRLHQSAAQEVTGEEVELSQSAAVDVKAASVSTYESALGLINSVDVEMKNSAAGAIRAENVNVTGQAGFVMANTANLGNAYAGLVAGREVHAEQIESIILLGNHIEGDVQTVVDTRGALIAGMVGGLFAGLILLLGRIAFGRK